MYKLKIKHQNDGVKIVSKLFGVTKLNRQELDYLCMIREPHIALPVSCSQNKLEYHIPYPTTLSQVLAAYVTEDLFFGIISDYVQVLSLVTNSDMSVNNLIIDPDYVYFDPASCSVQFIYQPLFDSELQTNVFYFFQTMLDQAILPTGESGSRIKSFRKFLSTQQYFSDTAFMEFLYPKESEPTPVYNKSVVDDQQPIDMFKGDSGDRSDSAGSAYDLDDAIPIMGDIGETAVLGDDSSAPSIERMKNGAKILVNKPEFKIGSDRTKTDFWISGNKAVSRVHAIIYTQGEKYVICDNHSTNRSYVNGSQLVPGTEYELHSKDKIVLADEEFEFVIR